MAAWRPDRLRLELLVVEERHHPARASVQERLAASGCSWRLIERPRGGRAAVIGVAAEQAEHEFLVVGGGTRAPLHLVTRALSFMWSEGGDAALVEDAAASTGDGPDPDASDDDVPGERAHGVGGAPAGDAAAELVAWLGLSEPLRPGRLVILRRWVARWLFNEVTRALSPADEVADRARLLGIGIVQLTEVEDADRPARPRGAGGGAPRAG